MREWKKKGPLWIVLAVALVVAAVYFIRPQPVLAGQSITLDHVTVQGQEVLDQVDQQALTQLLLEVQGSQMLSDLEDETGVVMVISGTTETGDFRLVLGDYNVLCCGSASYRVRGGSDLLVEINQLLPEEVGL